MIFKPGLAKLIVEGRKTATRRVRNKNPRSPWGPERRATADGREIEWIWRYPDGSTFVVNPGRGLRGVAECEVTARRTEGVEFATDEDARQEGFKDRVEFLRVFAKINRIPEGGLLPVVHVVEFKLLRVEDDAIERLDKLLAGG